MQPRAESWVLLDQPYHTCSVCSVFFPFFLFTLRKLVYTIQKQDGNPEVTQSISYHKVALPIPPKASKGIDAIGHKTDTCCLPSSPLTVLLACSLLFGPLEGRREAGQHLHPKNLPRLRRVSLSHPFSRLNNPSTFHPFLSGSVLQVCKYFQCLLCILGCNPIIIESQSWKVSGRWQKESQAQTGRSPGTRREGSPSEALPQSSPTEESPAQVSLKSYIKQKPPEQFL